MNINAQEAKIKLTIDNQTELTATMVQNSSVTALIELLKDGPLTIEMSDYGSMEKVGSIGTTLPRNDEQITTDPGDIILYQGSALVIYYAPNSWNFTRLGKIDNLTREELIDILGEGSVTVTLELADNGTHVNNTDTDMSHIRIYPNPAENFVSVEGKFETMTLRDLNGKNIITTRDKMINLSNIVPGIYTLFIKIAEGKEVVQKIIKK